MRFPPAVGKVIPASWPHTAGLVRAGRPDRPGLSGTSASANWAGYEDTGAGAQFTEVSANWTVPAVQAGTYGDSSTWVGIDGTSTSDLIQAGTDQSWSPNGAVYYAWYELLPGPSVELGLVSPGDEISAVVSKAQGGLWEVSVDDVTQHTSWDESLSYAAPATSAEWIEEAPTVSSSNSIESLADFGTVQFANLAVAGPGAVSASATPVYMVNNSNQIIAYPSEYSPGTDSFAVIYGNTSSLPASTTGASIPPPTTSTGPTTTTTAPPTSTPVRAAHQHGYLLAAGDGGIFAFGAAQFHGSTGKMRLTAPITGIAPTPDHGGYWLVGADGSVFAFGDADYAGSVPSMGIGPAGSKQRRRLTAPIVGISQPRVVRGTSWWPEMVGCSPSATATSRARARTRAAALPRWWPLSPMPRARDTGCCCPIAKWWHSGTLPRSPTPTARVLRIPTSSWLRRPPAHPMAAGTGCYWTTAPFTLREMPRPSVPGTPPTRRPPATLP